MTDVNKTMNMTAHFKDALNQSEPLTMELVDMGVSIELLHAKKKHPLFPKDRYEQVCIIIEEIGEVSKAAQENNIADYREELLQVIVTCKRALMTIDNSLPFKHIEITEQQ